MGKNKKHLYWTIALVLIAIIVCGTAIWINYHSWIVRFEMDNNTLEAIKSLNSTVKNIQPQNCFFNYRCLVNGTYFTGEYKSSDFSLCSQYFETYKSLENCKVIK